MIHWGQGWTPNNTRAGGVRAGRARSSEGAATSEREAFERILASLHEVALDPAHWSAATALIDDTLRAHGSSMVFGDGGCLRSCFRSSFSHRLVISVNPPSDPLLVVSDGCGGHHQGDRDFLLAIGASTLPHPSQCATWRPR